MLNNAIATPAVFDERPLPKSARTHGGVTFDPSSDKWAYRDGVSTVSLDFLAVSWVSPAFLHCMKFTLLWYAENFSPAHLCNGFWLLKYLFKELKALTKRDVEGMTSIDLINLRAHFGKGKAWYLGSVAGFLKQWHGLQLPGVSDDAVAFLNNAHFPGNPKGVAVLTMDPKQGPFTSIELEALQSAMTDAYARDEMGIADFLLCWLVMLLGQRPVQYASLKVCDVLPIGHEGSKTFILNMPRAKQQDAAPRSSFKKRPLILQVGELLAAYAESVRVRFNGVLADSGQAPLFPEDGSQLDYPEGLEFHHTGDKLRRRLASVLEKLKVVSERTGEPMNITATRFRRTIGTRAAAEGHGPLIIAELLDHTDTQNVWVYVEATPEMLDRIDRAMALQLAPLAQAFAGVIVEDDPRKGGDPAARVVAPQCTRDFTPVGNCGKHGFCGFAAPIACYTCRKFQAWLDGPHEAVLAYLVEERERLMVGTDPRIAAVNDRTILAVAQVVKQCQDIRAAGSQHG